jgi:MYXO-CTERM domain-containing protein
VSGAGEVLEPGGTPISTGPSTQRSPQVARVGGGYLVVWEDFRAGNADVYGRWVSADGRVAGPSDFPLATGPHDETTPAVASAGSPRSLVAYSGFVEQPDIRTRRVLGRLVALEPLAFMQSARTQEDVPLALVLGGAQLEGLPLTFQLVSDPVHGSLTGSPPELTYTPHTDFHGEDGLTFTVSDGQRTSEPVTVRLTVAPVNDVPVAEAQTVVVPEGIRSAVVLTGSDVDGDALSFTLASQPEQGTLIGTPPVLAYTPPEGFRGRTTFTFTISDGIATSAPATVTLVVGEEPSSPPPGGCGCAAGSSGGASAAGLLLALLGLLRIRQRTRG